MATTMMKKLGQKLTQRLTNSLQKKDAKLMYEDPFQASPLKTVTPPGGSGRVDLIKPGKVWKTTSPAPTPLGTVCNIIRQADGSLVVTGDQTLLREYFEQDPEQWLRCLALKESKNGKT